MATEFAIDRVRRFNKMKSVQKAGRKNLGVRFSIEELLQLVTKLTGKRALLVDEPAGARPILDNAELALVTAGQPNGGPYRLTVSMVSMEEPGITNEDNSPGDFNATKYPTATGVVLMVGKDRPAMALTLESFPVVGEDILNGPNGDSHEWSFILHSGRKEYAFTDGGGGTGSKTPPPGS